MSNRLKISVALAMYNGEKHIKKQLDSIINQSLCVDEIVISDDGSTDTSLSIVNKIIADCVTNISFKIVKNINHGHVQNFINALKKCSGDIIFLSDQDDFWYNDKVMSHINVHDKYGCDLCASAFNVVGEYGNMLINHKASNITKILTLKQAIANRMPNGMSMSIRRCENFDMMLEKMMVYKPWAHDSFINIYYALQYKVCFLDKVCADHIIHEDNVAGARIGNKLRGSYSDRLRIASNYNDLYTNFDEMLINKEIQSKCSNNLYFYNLCSRKAHERYRIYKNKDSIKLFLHALRYRDYYSSIKTFMADILYSFKMLGVKK